MPANIPLYSANGQPVQFDDTGKPAVSLYAKRTVAGDTPLVVSAKGEAKVTSHAAVRLGDGGAYLASTGKMNLAVAGNLRITFNNPSTSGKNVVIQQLVGANSASAMAWAEVRLGPTTGLPATALIVPKNAIWLAANDNNLSVVEMRADTDTTTPIGGGTKVLDLAVPPGRREVYSLTIVLTPGVMVGVNVVFAGAADSVLNAYYYEDPI